MYLALLLSLLLSLNNHLVVQGARTTMNVVGLSMYHKIIQNFVIDYTSHEHSIGLNYIDVEEEHQILCRASLNISECSQDDTANLVEADLMITDYPIVENLQGEYSDIEYFPFFASPIVPVFNIPGFPNNETLCLTLQIFARMLRKCPEGQPGCEANTIRFWNDSAITALNPNVISILNNAGEIFPIVPETSIGLNYVVKSTLAQADSPEFTDQVPIDSSPDWGLNSQAIKLPYSHIAGYISRHPGSITFAHFSDVRNLNDVHLAGFFSPSAQRTLKVSLLSASAAVNERGTVPFVFKNFSNVNQFEEADDLHVQLIFDVSRASGEVAWPLIGYTYFGLRERHLRTGVDCSHRLSIIDFFEHLFSDKKSIIPAYELNSVVEIPTLAQETVYAHMLADIVCDDVPVGEIIHSNLDKLGADDNMIRFPAELGRIFGIFFERFGLRIEDDAPIAFEIRSRVLDESVIQLPTFGVVFAVEFNLCEAGDECELHHAELVLDVNTLVSILNGEIQFWNHTQIGQLNPSLAFPNETIQVLLPPSEEFGLSNLLSKLTGGRTVTLAAAVVNETDLADVSYSLRVNPHLQVSNLGENEAASILHNGNTNFPSKDSVANCAQDTFDPDTLSFDFSSSQNDGCYALTQTLYVIFDEEGLPSEACELSDGLKHNSKLLSQISFLSVQRFRSGFEEYDDLGNSIRAQVDNAAFDEVNFKFPRDFSERVAQDSGLVIIPYLNPKQGITLLRKRYMQEFMKMKCNGESLIADSEIILEVSKGLEITFLLFFCLSLLFFFSIGLWVRAYRKSRLVRNSSPTLLYAILLGASIGMLAIPLLGFYNRNIDRLNPSLLTESELESSTQLCYGGFLTVAFGYSLMLLALYAKMYRMIYIFNAKVLKLKVKSDYELLFRSFALSSIICIIIGICFYLAELEYRVFIIRSDPNTGNILESFSGCSVNRPSVIFAPLAIFFVLLIFAGNYLSFKSRAIPSEYSEGTYVAAAMGVVAQASLFGIPLLALAGDAQILYLAEGILIHVIFVFPIALIFLPKVFIQKGWIGTTTDIFRESAEPTAGKGQRKTTENPDSKNDPSKVSVTNLAPSSPDLRSKLKVAQVQALSARLDMLTQLPTSAAASASGAQASPKELKQFIVVDFEDPSLHIINPDPSSTSSVDNATRAAVAPWASMPVKKNNR